jgi:hypothetical protein
MIRLRASDRSSATRIGMSFGSKGRNDPRLPILINTHGGGNCESFMKRKKARESPVFFDVMQGGRCPLRSPPRNHFW